MSRFWVGDIAQMHQKYKIHKWVNDPANAEKLKAFLKFRIDFLKEEYDETVEAFDNEDPEEIIDGLIDLCVIAIGTLDIFDVDAQKAWDEVLSANMKKSVGIKKDRPNPLNVPDLVKDTDWENPSHKGNHGILPKVFK
jgi:hypothetical protein